MISVNSRPPVAVPPPQHRPGRVGPPGRLYRAWKALRGLFAPAVRDRSAYEQALAEELARVTDTLNGREDDLYRLRVDLRAAQDEIRLLQLQVKMLAEIHETDRARIAADTATYVRSAAQE